jgi:hypothetical protein
MLPYQETGSDVEHLKKGTFVLRNTKSITLKDTVRLEFYIYIYILATDVSKGPNTLQVFHQWKLRHFLSSELPEELT